MSEIKIPKKKKLNFTRTIKFCNASLMDANHAALFICLCIVEDDIFLKKEKNKKQIHFKAL